MVVFFFQAEDGIRDLVRSRGLGDVYKRQTLAGADSLCRQWDTAHRQQSGGELDSPNRHWQKELVVRGFGASG